MDGSDIDDNVAVQRLIMWLTLIVTMLLLIILGLRWMILLRVQAVLVPPSVVIPGVIAFTDSVAHEWFGSCWIKQRWTNKC